MMFKSKEEMQRYCRYLKYRDFCKKMSLWLLTPLLMVCLSSTVYTFMSLDMFRYSYAEVTSIERFCYVSWCVFTVVLSKGIVRYKNLTGYRKFTVIVFLSMIVTFLIANINMYIRFEPYSAESYIDGLLSDLLYNVGYGILRYPAVYFAVSRCSIVLSSEVYYRFAETAAKHIRRLRWKKLEKKLIDIFSVVDEFDDQEV